ncbi:MAG: dTDP-4-amino-4,6-dideoxygalactose transaminase [Solirubrobacteraceae bacterium]
MTHIPFNRAYSGGAGLDHIRQAIDNAAIAADGEFSRRCRQWLIERTGSVGALLTPSCTAALELSALLLDLGPGDEVIMPSFTFVTTATAFVLRQCTPIFVDIRPDTLNLDETLLEQAIGPRTKAVVPVHYGSVGCEMDDIMALARSRDLRVVEDAAHSLLASYRGRPLGTIGDLGTLSFHETKNVTSGEGGALLVNDPELVDRAEILKDKGTNRARFFKGQVDKYTWVDIGSSYGLSDLAAAFLWGQFELCDVITAQRQRIWRRYHDAFADLENEGRLRRPFVPAHCQPNAHLYYLLLDDESDRDRVIETLAEASINAVFHYVPLHSSPAGERYGRVASDMSVTDDISARLVRLPIWADMPDSAVARVIATTRDALLSRRHATSRG